MEILNYGKEDDRLTLLRGQTGIYISGAYRGHIASLEQHTPPVVDPRINDPNMYTITVFFVIVQMIRLL
jgi:hypothetical protein